MQRNMVIRNAARCKPIASEAWAPSLVPGHAKEVVNGPPWQGVWAARSTMALVRRYSGGLCCCMLTP